MTSPAFLHKALALFTLSFPGQWQAAPDPRVVFERAQTALVNKDYPVRKRVSSWAKPASKQGEEAQQELAAAEKLQATARDRQAEQCSGKLPSPYPRAE